MTPPSNPSPETGEKLSTFEQITAVLAEIDPTGDTFVQARSDTTGEDVFSLLEKTPYLHSRIESSDEEDVLRYVKIQSALKNLETNTGFIFDLSSKKEGNQTVYAVSYQNQQLADQFSVEHMMFYLEKIVPRLVALVHQCEIEISVGVDSVNFKVDGNDPKFSVHALRLPKDTLAGGRSVEFQLAALLDLYHIE